MRASRAAFAGALLLASGCVYYNALYNAERLLEEGESHHRAGRDSLADARYAEVIQKAAAGYRREPDGAWADDALLLMGQAYLRRGELREARASLEEAARRAGSEEVRLQALLRLGEAYVIADDVERAIPLLNEALEGLPGTHFRAEGHLWRGRALLAAGEPYAGWWDLDQAAGEGRVRVEAALARLAWAVRLDDQGRAREGMRRLLASSEAGVRVDTVVALAREAARRWGPSEGVALLQGADTARWAPAARGKIRMVQAALLRSSGDTAGAEAVMRRVAAGIGPVAADARLELAAWHLALARDASQARGALPLLLPAADAPAVSARLGELQRMIELADRGVTEPLAWFAAAEEARDAVGAPIVARGLFLAYAGAAPEDPWVPKALLAALALAESDGDEAYLRGRLEGWADSPYVLAARGEPALGLEALEEELARRLDEMRTR